MAPAAALWATLPLLASFSSHVARHRPQDTAPPHAPTQVAPVVMIDVRQAVGEKAYDAVSGVASVLVNNKGERERAMPVGEALRRLDRDMRLLDDAAARNPKLTNIEILLLSSTVAISAASPALLTVKLAEVLVPSMAAVAAAIGLSAEYVGRVEVSRGKEIAAVTLQAAAESESILAQAERAKAVVPLCVGISTTASAFALLAPALIADLAPRLGVQIVTEARSRMRSRCDHAIPDAIMGSCMRSGCNVNPMHG